MEVQLLNLNPATQNFPPNFCRVSIPFATKFPISTCRYKKSRLPSCKFPAHSIFLSLPAARNFRIIAHFGRPANRRNSLRKKLTEHHQVRPNPVIHDSASDFQGLVDNSDNFVTSQRNSDNGSGRRGSFSSNSGVVHEIDACESKPNHFGESILWNKLEGWVDQYTKDSEFWGIGFGPIFTVFQDSNGNVKRAVVNEDEILRRSGIKPSLYKQSEFEDLTEVNSKISYAKHLAKEIESGTHMLSKNSSVAKFVVSDGQSGFVNSFQHVSLLQPALLSKLPRIGILVLCGLAVFFATKTLFTAGKGDTEYSRLEKEMMRRKIKARMEKKKLVKGSVEVIQDVKEPQMLSAKWPQLDKQQLRSSIFKAKASNDKLACTEATESMDFEDKIQEIRAMAKHARETERRNFILGDSNKIDETLNGLPDEKDLDKKLEEKVLSFPTNLYNGYSSQTKGNGTVEPTSFTDAKSSQIGFFTEAASIENSDLQTSNVSSLKTSYDGKTTIEETKDTENALNLLDASNNQLCILKENSVGIKPRESLSQKPDKQMPNQEVQVRTMQGDASILCLPNEEEIDGDSNQGLDKDNKLLRPSILGGTPDLAPAKNVREDSILKEEDHVPTKNSGFGAAEVEFGGTARQMPTTLIKNIDAQTFDTSSMKVLTTHDDSIVQDGEDGSLNISNTIKANQSFDTPNNQSHKPKKSSIRRKTRVIQSVKEAREFLSRERCKQDLNHDDQLRTVQEGAPIFGLLDVKRIDSSTSQRSDNDDKAFDIYNSSGISRLKPPTHSSEDSNLRRRESGPTKDNDSEAAGAGVQLPIPNTSCEGRGSIIETELSVLKFPSENENDNTSGKETEKDSKVFLQSKLGGPSDSTSVIDHRDFSLKAKAYVPTRNDDCEDVDEGYEVVDHQNSEASFDSENSSKTVEAAAPMNKESWIEENFHDFEPVVKKIQVGFRDNYMVARDKKTKQELNLNSEMIHSRSEEEDSELEWMKDDKLREIVFLVRDNELAGRDPFYLMDDQDKHMFFEGLERKVEKENEKLLNLHEWVHSNIENVDYGADGISLYDPPEKIIPCWKGPPIDRSPDVLNKFVEQRKALGAENLSTLELGKKDGHDSLQMLKESPSCTGAVSIQNSNVQDGVSNSLKTVIECSDGSVRAGKKSGKEYWQHTKKWSQGFLECYNAETDPEMKAVMKDIGKDLDRWITEKEIQEAADLMNKIPERGRKLIEQKLNKVKREMELFGPEAVMSKYREYAEEKEKDYLWWLDLPFVLCIELYTRENEEQRVGFYSLEMAADLELDPKQYHVIAFEDAGDCKNLCYIIQSRMQMLENGNAFVVARLAKDAFREAKANGFNVTVIRKGKLPLNVDQTLEEVEEQITEIGSKIYHDKIMQERSVDISSLMKGVFGVKKPTKRLKRKHKRLSKP